MAPQATPQTGRSPLTPTPPHPPLPGGQAGARGPTRAGLSRGLSLEAPGGRFGRKEGEKDEPPRVVSF